MEINDFKAQEREYQYILTEEEEIRHIDYALSNELSHLKWLSEQKVGRERTLERIENREIVPKIDREYVLREANKRKHWEIEEKELIQKRKEREMQYRKNMLEKTNYAYMYRFMTLEHKKRFATDQFPEFIYDDQNEKLIKAICFFLSQDARFEKIECELTGKKFSLKKGLMIMGGYGVGKTHILQCVAQNERTPINIYSMIKISSSLLKKEDISIDYSKVIYLDDVGTEESTLNVYGTKITWFKDFIENYSLDKLKPNKLIISTNCNFDEIEEKYTGRVRSRMAEMFNFIKVTGTDRRKS